MFNLPRELFNMFARFFILFILKFLQSPILWEFTGRLLPGELVLSPNSHIIAVLEIAAFIYPSLGIVIRFRGGRSSTTRLGRIGCIQFCFLALVTVTVKRNTELV